MAMIAKLTPITNLTQLKPIDIVKNKFTFGRQPSCDHVFTDLRSSSTHAIIQYNPSNKVFILLDKSTNGTWLNSNLIGKGNKVKLSHDDTITFVRTRIEYKFIIPSPSPQIKIKPKPKPKPIIASNICLMSLDPFAENNEHSAPKPSRKRKAMIKAEHTPSKKKRKLFNIDGDIAPLQPSSPVASSSNNRIQPNTKQNAKKKESTKVTKMKNPRRMRASDVRNLEIETRSGLFSGVVALMIAKKSRRLDIIMEKFIENGGEMYDQMDVNANYELIQQINTIIMTKTMPFVKLQKVIQDVSMIPQYHVTTLDWISDCIQHKKVLNTRKYIPKCLRNNPKINIRQINTGPSPVKQQAMEPMEEDPDYEVEEEEEEKASEDYKEAQNTNNNNHNTNKKNVNMNDLMMMNTDSEDEDRNDMITKSTQQMDMFTIEQMEHKLLIIKHKDWKSSANILSFDMDGTIITTQSGHRFPKFWRDFKLLYDYSQVMEPKLMEYYDLGYSFVVFSNQKMSHLRHKKPAQFHQKIADLKQKIPAIFKQITIKGNHQQMIPFVYIAALDDDVHRKPHRGMFDYFNKTINLCTPQQLKRVLYVGDAAGREKGWKNGRTGKADFSHSDRAFAANCNMTFYTPEEFWLNAAKCLRFRLMDLANILKQAKSNKYPKELVNINNGEQSMVILVGYPGCGKTTLYKRFFYGHNYKHINRDTLGSMDKCQIQCEMFLEQKYSVVIDNTNPSKIARRRFIAIAKKHNVKIECVWIQMDRAISHHLNVLRWRMNQSNTKIPVQAYKKFDKEFNKPQQIEGFSRIIHVPFVFDRGLYDESEFLLHT